MRPRFPLLVAIPALIGACDRTVESTGSNCILAIDSTTAAGESDTLVGDSPLCSPDVIHLERLVTLGGDEPGALSNAPYDVAIDSRGRFYLLGSHSAPIEPPVVYSVEGRFLTALGRLGDGPGEFQMPGALIIMPGDTIVVLDAANRRISVFSPNHDFIRGGALAGRLESVLRVAVVLSDGRLATNMDTRIRRDSSGPALHILHPDWRIAHSFGNDSIPIRRWLDGSRSMRVLGHARRGFWSGTLRFQYRLELWDHTGNRIKLLRRQPAWFQPYDTLVGTTPDHPPHPMLVGVMEDYDGRVWTLSWVADSQWVKGLSKAPVRGEGGTLYYRTEDPEALFDSYLEILDPISGRLLLSRRFDGLFSYLINDTLIGRQVYDENGIPAVEIYQVTPSL